MEDEMQQLKASLAKYAQSEVLTLPEAAVKIGVAEKYLLELIKRGKMKAFKVGNDWLLEARWLENFRDEIKSGLNQEIAERFADSGPEHNIWSRKLSKPKSIANFFIFFKLAEAVSAIFLLAITSIGISILLLPMSSVNFDRPPSPLGYGETSGIAEKSLSIIYNFYGWPIYIGRQVAAHEKINDENLTVMIYQLAGQKPAGVVAGEFEVNGEIR